MVTDDIYQALAERLNCPGSKRLLRVLRKLVNPDEAKLLLELPAEPDELASRTGMDRDTVELKLREFVEKGVAIPTSKGICMARDVAQLHDANLSSLDRWLDTELLDLWKDFQEYEWLESMSDLGDTHFNAIRVIPAIDDLMPEEDIRALIKDADPVAVVKCSCRRSMRRCDCPVDICLQFNRGAEYHINRGSGRRLTDDKAIALADKAEEEGLIHTWPLAAFGRLNEICNCCRDCCVIFDAGLRFGTVGQLLEKSRFRAEADRELCTGCQDCIERCFFGAIEMVKPPQGGIAVAKVDEAKCFGCGLCTLVCEPGAVAMRPAQT
jgi:ferredoxin